MDIMQYTENLTDICGVAHLMEDKERLIETYGDDICKYPYAIVVGHLMDHDIIESIPLSYNDDKIAQDYLDEYFNSHQRAAKIADKIADFIKKQGFDAIVLDVSGDSDEVNLKMPFSNKASANIAHIGYIVISAIAAPITVPINDFLVKIIKILLSPFVSLGIMYEYLAII